jgi:uncharacterized protein
MKQFFFTLLLFALYGAAVAQAIEGKWAGTLDVGSTKLNVVFTIVKTIDGYKSTMDSPDQGAMDIAVSSTKFENQQLTLIINNGSIEYIGELKDQKITGTLKQNGASFPLHLTKEVAESKKMIRPQEPMAPYPYHTEEISFHNSKAGVTLAGTLTLPKKEGKFPAVILISGSGPQNRDEELLGHKPFLVIADYLTINGIAVLRFDDRGVAQSTGTFKTATTADFADDATSALDYLQSRKEIFTQKIGLVGHSEGGIIAPMIAARSNQVAFIVMLAGTGLRGDRLLLLQQELIAKAMGEPEKEISITKEINGKVFEMILDSKNEHEEKLKERIKKYLVDAIKKYPTAQKPTGMSDEDFANTQVAQLLNPGLVYLIRHDPATVLSKVKCPVLALNGDKDLQVPAEENLSIIEQQLAIAGNKKVVVRKYPGLNHLFQEAKTGSPSEYAQIEQTFSPIVLADMASWIKKTVR